MGLHMYTHARTHIVQIYVYNIYICINVYVYMYAVRAKRETPSEAVIGKRSSWLRSSSS